MANPVGTRLFNAFRGSLIGMAEAVPGVSGGTVALIVGIYEQLIAAASFLTSAVRIAAADLPRGRGLRRAAAQVRQADWHLLLPAIVGMVAALALSAKLIAPLVEEHQQYAFALFFGLVLVSVWIPYTGSGRRWSPADYLLALAVAAGAFALTGLSLAETSHHPLVVLAAGSVAICALVLPGVSGSFLLLALGMYESTIDAVNERDLGYLGAFALGCAVGLALFVKLLRWLLQHHHHRTLVVMTGLMAGSLRALWPWQGEDRTLHAPHGAPENILLTGSLAVLGAAVVVTALLVERRIQRNPSGSGPRSGTGRDEGAPAGADRGRGRHARVGG